MAIRYILQNPAITAPIPGLISTQQVDNMALAVRERRQLDPKEIAELQQANRADVGETPGELSVAEKIGIRVGRLCAMIVVAACVWAPATARAQSYIPPQAINDRCVTCHLPFKNEDLVATHFKAARAPAFEAGTSRASAVTGQERRASGR